MSKQILNDFAEGLVLRGSVRANALPGATRLEKNAKEGSSHFLRVWLIVAEDATVESIDKSPAKQDNFSEAAPPPEQATPMRISAGALLSMRIYISDSADNQRITQEQLQALGWTGTLSDVNQLTELIACGVTPEDPKDYAAAFADAKRDPRGFGERLAPVSLRPEFVSTEGGGYWLTKVRPSGGTTQVLSGAEVTGFLSRFRKGSGGWASKNSTAPAGDAAAQAKRPERAVLPTTPARSDADESF